MWWENSELTTERDSFCFLLCLASTAPTSCTDLHLFQFEVLDATAQFGDVLFVPILLETCPELDCRVITNKTMLVCRILTQLKLHEQWDIWLVHIDGRQDCGTYYTHSLTHTNKEKSQILMWSIGSCWGGGSCWGVMLGGSCWGGPPHEFYTSYSCYSWPVKHFVGDTQVWSFKGLFNLRSVSAVDLRSALLQGEWRPGTNALLISIPSAQSNKSPTIWKKNRRNNDKKMAGVDRWLNKD